MEEKTEPTFEAFDSVCKGQGGHEGPTQCRPSPAGRPIVTDGDGEGRSGGVGRQAHGGAPGGGGGGGGDVHVEARPTRQLAPRGEEPLLALNPDHGGGREAPQRRKK